MNAEPVIHKVPIIIGMRSLIGVFGERPVGWGNYFYLSINNKQVRVLNMWLENLKEAQHTFLLDNLVEIRQYDTVCIITDDRIPLDWYYNKLCFTGGPPVSLKTVKDIYNLIGDPGNELEQFTAPKSYWEKRGWIYNEKNGLLIKRYGEANV